MQLVPKVCRLWSYWCILLICATGSVSCWYYVVLHRREVIFPYAPWIWMKFLFSQIICGIACSSSQGQVMLGNDRCRKERMRAVLKVETAADCYTNQKRKFYRERGKQRKRGKTMGGSKWDAGWKDASIERRVRDIRHTSALWSL